jgi:hypothetical protein
MVIMHLKTPAVSIPHTNFSDREPDAEETLITNNFECEAEGSEGLPGPTAEELQTTYFLLQLSRPSETSAGNGYAYTVGADCRGSV